MNRDDWIYLAGFVDGEGCIHCMRNRNNPNRSYYYPALVITQKDSNYLVWLKQKMGGHLYQDARGYYIYKITGKACIEVLNQLTPFLRLKKAQAILAMTIPDAPNKEAVREKLKKLKRTA